MNEYRYHEGYAQVIGNIITTTPGEEHSRRSRCMPQISPVESQPLQGFSLRLPRESRDISQHKLVLYTHSPVGGTRNSTSSPSPLRGLLLGLIGYGRHVCSRGVTSRETACHKQAATLARYVGWPLLRGHPAAGYVYFCRSVVTEGSLAHRISQA